MGLITIPGAADYMDWPTWGLPMTNAVNDHDQKLASLTRLAAYRNVDSASIANDVTVNDDTQLVVPVPATGVYAIDGLLMWSCASNTPDFRLSWSVPTGATIDNWTMIAPDTTVASASAPGNWGVQPNATTDGVVGATVGQLAGIPKGLLILGGTAGNMVLRWAQGTSDANGVKLLKGSHVYLIPVG